jgi:hypothetical protein
VHDLATTEASLLSTRFLTDHISRSTSQQRSTIHHLYALAHATKSLNGIVSCCLSRKRGLMWKRGRMRLISLCGPTRTRTSRLSPPCYPGIWFCSLPILNPSSRLHLRASITHVESACRVPPMTSLFYPAKCHQPRLLLQLTAYKPQWNRKSSSGRVVSISTCVHLSTSRDDLR